MAKKTTGIGKGADAIFGNTPQDAAPTERSQPAGGRKQDAPKAAPKHRTSVVLSAQTIITMRKMQDMALMDGEKITYSDIIDEAVATLARIKNIEA